MKTNEIRQTNERFEKIKKEIKKKIYESLTDNLSFGDRWKKEIENICQLRTIDSREYYKKCKNIFAMR